MTKIKFSVEAIKNCINKDEPKNKDVMIVGGGLGIYLLFGPSNLTYVIDGALSSFKEIRKEFPLDFEDVVCTGEQMEKIVNMNPAPKTIDFQLINDGDVWEMTYGLPKKQVPQQANEVEYIVVGLKSTSKKYPVIIEQTQNKGQFSGFSSIGLTMAELY